MKCDAFENPPSLLVLDPAHLDVSDDAMLLLTATLFMRPIAMRMMLLIRWIWVAVAERWMPFLGVM